MIFENILETIGNTPLVKITRITPNKKVIICAKLEGFNPSGSIKDRIALKMIEQAEAEGDAKTCERLQNQLEKFEAKQLRLEERKAERPAVRAEKAWKKGQD